MPYNHYLLHACQKGTNFASDFSRSIPPPLENNYKFTNSNIYKLNKRCYEKELFSMESVVGLLVSRICRIWYVAGNEGVIIFVGYS